MLQAEVLFCCMNKVKNKIDYSMATTYLYVIANFVT